MVTPIGSYCVYGSLTSFVTSRPCLSMDLVFHSSLYSLIGANLNSCSNKLNDLKLKVATKLIQIQKYYSDGYPSYTRLHACSYTVASMPNLKVIYLLALEREPQALIGLDSSSLDRDMNLMI